MTWKRPIAYLALTAGTAAALAAWYLKDPGQAAPGGGQKEDGRPVVAADREAREVAGTAPAPGESGDVVEFTLFEKQVLLALSSLDGEAEAAPFLEELGQDPSLRSELEGTPGPAAMRRFQTLVRKHARLPGFQEAVEHAGSPKPCGNAPSSGPAFAPSLLQPPDPGCAPAEQDLLAPIQ
ncbi:MAG: hypothetical protein ABII00_08295 [Elusimicrobiota bacterium]